MESIFVFKTFWIIFLSCQQGTNAISLSLTPTAAKVLENGSLKLTCSLSENQTFVKWDSTISGKAAIGFNQNNCRASLFLNNSSLYEWSCQSRSFSLTIKSVQLSQHDEKWFCFLGDGTVRSNNATINVKVRVSSVTLDTPSSSSVTVPENTLLSFRCTTSRSRPSPTISWYIDGDIAATNDDVLISQLVSQSPVVGSDGYVATTGSLTYKPPRDANGKYVFCKSREADGYTVLSDRKIRLSVTYMPDSGPLIQSYINNTVYYAIDNKQHTLTCTVTGGNPLASLSWSCFTGTEEDLSSGHIVSTRWQWRTSSDGTCTCTSTHLSVAENVVLNVRMLSPPSTPVFLLYSKTFQDSTTVKIIRDSSAAITCSATSSPSPDKYTWTYDGQTTALSQVASLIPSQITADGRYWCQVRNTMRPSQGQVENGSSSAFINVQRLFPPTKPVLKYDSGSGTTLPGSFKVVKGDNFNMHCSSTGNPSPSYLWTGDGRNTHNQIIAVSAITLDRVYTCKATNTMTPTFLSNVPGSSSTTVSVSVLSPPTNPTKTYHYSQSDSTSLATSLKVIRGKSFNVECAASAVPAPSLSWAGPQTSSSGKLMFTSIQESNDGTYNCTARNIMDRTFGPQEVGTRDTSLQIHVLYAPSVNTFNVEPIVEGSALSVECKTLPGNPASTTYSWKRKLSSSSDNTWRDIPGTSVNGGRLLKTNINRNDTGTYRCTASNVMKPTAEQQQIGSNSKTFILNVLYEASITAFFIEGHRGQTIVTVDENDGGIRFTCEVDSNPTSTVKLLFNGEIIKESSNTNHISFIHSSVACLDGGVYTCEGNNQYGQSSLKNIQLFVKCSPRSLHQMRQNITSVLHVPITLSFTTLAYPLPGTKGFAWFREDGGSWMRVLSNADLRISSSALQSNLTILNVSKADYGRYRLTVRNNIGNYSQYLFLQEDVVAEVGSSETCVKYSKMDSDNTAVITGISLGLVVAVLTVYSTSITVLYKRKTTSKDSQLVVRESTQKTYVNVAYSPNQNNDGATEAESDDAKHYTDLAEYSRDNRTTYEVLHDH